MKQVLNIAWKDLKMTFRDPMGLVLMLAAPIGLTLVIAFAFGGLGGSKSSGGLHDIPVAILNEDKGSYGSIFANVLMPTTDQVASDAQSKQIADLIDAKLVHTESEARDLVDNKQYAAAIFIPGSFSESITPSGLSAGSASTDMKEIVITLYVNPARMISANVVRSISQSIVDQFMAGSAAGQIAITSLISSGKLTPVDAASQGSAIANEVVKVVLAQNPVQVESTVYSAQSSTANQEQESAAQATNKGFNWLGYMAPSMAVMYLMFTMTNASRSILNEQQHGTLPRMMVSPTSRASVLGGKMLGVYITGLMQMAVLILAGKLLFNISYGEPLAVLVFTLVLVAAATAWGMLEAAISKSPGQANALGWLVNLSFAAVAGNFIPRQAYPAWLQNIGLITPNAWGIDTFYKLVQGGSFNVIYLPILVLAGMTVVLFVAAVLIFRKRFA